VSASVLFFAPTGALPLGTFRGAPRVSYTTSSATGNFAFVTLGGGGGANENGRTGSYLYREDVTFPFTIYSANGGGGNGIQYNTFTSSYFGGGGGAGSSMTYTFTLDTGFYSSSQGFAGSGSLGGGGNGACFFISQSSLTRFAESGIPNSGGGGGGAAGFSATASLRPIANDYFTAGSGGSGIAIIRYPGPQRGTGGTVTTSGSYTYHTFTSTGFYSA
jgi:hypothetical protein